jgi:hypothetical protein
MLEKSWHEAFESVAKTHGADEPTDRFCAGTPVSTGDLAPALDRCDIYGDSTEKAASKRGNVMLHVSVVIAAEYAVDWGVRATGFGFKGRIELMKLGEVIAYVESTPAEGDVGTEAAAMEATFSLTPGAHTFNLYGVYSAADETSVRAAPTSAMHSYYGVPQLLFKQEEFCGMTDFMKLEVGALDCTFEAPEETESIDPASYEYSPPSIRSKCPTPSPSPSSR